MDRDHDFVGVDAAFGRLVATTVGLDPAQRTPREDPRRSTRPQGSSGVPMTIEEIQRECQHQFCDAAGKRVYLYCQRGCGTMDPLDPLEVENWEGVIRGKGPMKLDLDELERKATAASTGHWMRGVDGRDVVARTETRDWPIARTIGGFDADYIAANSPPVTLALIARIRELEDVATRYAGSLERESYDEQAAEIRAIVDKGTVLP